MRAFNLVRKFSFCAKLVQTAINMDVQVTNFEPVLDTSPAWLKKCYTHLMHAVGKGLDHVGLMHWLEKKAPDNQRYHFIRSLFAIHQLGDMIQLDTPWWTYEAITKVDALLQAQNRQAVIFEYGSGASTIWLAKRAQTVISIEHDAEWFEKLQAYKQEYAHIMLLHEPPILKQNTTNSLYTSAKAPNLDFTRYASSIDDFSRLFDVIIIDGRARVACLQHALAKCHPNGFIVFDNSNRERYQQALKQRGRLRIERYPGRVPGSPFKSETAIIYKK